MQLLAVKPAQVVGVAQDMADAVVTAGDPTEAGINYCAEKGFLEIFVEGLSRSTRRARELDAAWASR